MLYSDPENAGELASRMESVITSKATRDRLSERALKRASQFSWNRCVNETVGMYAKLSN
jgi:glycosyltransferase involved in cell wall biosynthesis